MIHRTGEQHLEFWAKHRPGETLIYVLQCEPGTPIKVGIARDVQSRIASLQTGNPNRLYLMFVAPGDQQLERALHHKLRDCRGLGEWFLGPEIADFLKWFEGVAWEAVDTYERTGELPPPPIAPPKKQPTPPPKKEKPLGRGY